jgi:hypothetical protein
MAEKSVLIEWFRVGPSTHPSTLAHPTPTTRVLRLSQAVMTGAVFHLATLARMAATRSQASAAAILPATRRGTSFLLAVSIASASLGLWCVYEFHERGLHYMV